MKRMIFPTALVLNLSLFLLCLTYPIPNLDVFPWMIAVSHILLFLLNLKAGRTWPQIVLLSGVHVAATYLTHQFYTLLYFLRILGSLDGRKWTMGLCVIDTVWTMILFLFAVIIFGIRTGRGSKPGT